ncbi:MAG: SoxR reducing system RseC family protein [Eubacteriales bacterium]|jgi:sigma-E factor negative regulatory protein RseC
MEQTAKVIGIEGSRARIMVVRKSACGHDCSKCGGACGKETPLIAYAENPLGAQVGDFVEIHTRDGELLRNAAVTYMVPIVVFLVGFVAAYLGGMPQGTSALIGGLAFVLAIAGVIVYDRKVARFAALPVIQRIIR